MKKTRFSEEQMVTILLEVDTKPVPDVAKKRVYPGFPTIFRGLSEFFVGDLMGKALWKLVENAQRFPRRGGRVLCVHGPVCAGHA